MSAKEIIVRSIDSSSAKALCKKYHYSGKVVPNSQIHLGVFYKGRCEGVMQFGPSTDKRRMAQNLSVGINEFLELNRMAFSDVLPRFSESRAISVAIKILKKKYPFLRLIISFADACQCGDGAIYRASGFKLHSFKKNSSLLVLSDDAIAYIKKYIPNVGRVASDKSLNNIIAPKSLDNHKDMQGKYLTSVAKNLGSKPLVGYQMKYLYLIDKSLEKNFKWVPFSEIPNHIKMYKGKKRE